MADAFEQAWGSLRKSANNQKRFDPNTGKVISWAESEGEKRFKEPKTSLPRPTHLVRHVNDWGEEGFHLVTPEYRHFIASLSDVDFDENHLSNFSSNTNPNYRRQGYYNKLLRALLARGYDIESDNRNKKSQPFHEKFMQNLPPGVNLSIYNVRPDDTSIHEASSILYEPEIPYAENSPLKQYDIGAYPFQDLTRNNSRPFDSSKQASLTDF